MSLESHHICENINVISQTREFASHVIAQSLEGAQGISEKELAQKIHNRLTINKDLYECGWYSPPPMGISVLAEEKSNLNRLLFDSLRKEEFWPSDNIISTESIIFIYCSPLNKKNALFGDIGITLYAGEDQFISDHLKKALNILIQIAEYTEVGMEFREICDYAQIIFKENNVNNDRALLLTTGVDEFNLGHTIPFSYELPNEEEKQIIDSGEFVSVRNLVSHKRIYVGPNEKFKIQNTCAFTIEARLEDNDNKEYPNNFFHLIVTFKEGLKEVHINYDEAGKMWGAKNL